MSVKTVLFLALVIAFAGAKAVAGRNEIPETENAIAAGLVHLVMNRAGPGEAQASVQLGALRGEGPGLHRGPATDAGRDRPEDVEEHASARSHAGALYHVGAPYNDGLDVPQDCGRYPTGWRLVEVLAEDAAEVYGDL